MTLARPVPVTPGTLSQWPAVGASDTVMASHEAFQGLTFGAEKQPGTRTRSWPVTEPSGYALSRAALQKDQLVKAGARLAQLLQAVWP